MTAAGSGRGRDIADEGAAMDDEQFQALIRQARDRDDQAIAELLRHFEGEVRLIVRSHLPRALRVQFDSMDFVQSVFTSLFTGPEPGGEPAFESPRHFLGYLSGIAQNKVREEYRRRTRTKKYELGREEPLYVRRGEREEPRSVAASDPTPSAEAQATECLDQLLAGRSPAEVAALRLRGQGVTFEEIAARTGLSERTVRRLIDTLRARMEERQWR